MADTNYTGGPQSYSGESLMQGNGPGYASQNPFQFQPPKPPMPSGAPMRMGAGTPQPPSSIAHLLEFLKSFQGGKPAPGMAEQILAHLEQTQGPPPPAAPKMGSSNMLPPGLSPDEASLVSQAHPNQSRMGSSFQLPGAPKPQNPQGNEDLEALVNTFSLPSSGAPRAYSPGAPHSTGPFKPKGVGMGGPAAPRPSMPSMRAMAGEGGPGMAMASKAVGPGVSSPRDLPMQKTPLDGNALPPMYGMPGANLPSSQIGDGSDNMNQPALPSDQTMGNAGGLGQQGFDNATEGPTQTNMQRLQSPPNHNKLSSILRAILGVQ